MKHITCSIPGEVCFVLHLVHAKEVSGRFLFGDRMQQPHKPCCVCFTVFIGTALGLVTAGWMPFATSCST